MGNKKYVIMIRNDSDGVKTVDADSNRRIKNLQKCGYRIISRFSIKYSFLPKGIKIIAGAKMINRSRDEYFTEKTRGAEGEKNDGEGSD